MEVDEKDYTQPAEESFKVLLNVKSYCPYILIHASFVTRCFYVVYIHRLRLCMVLNFFPVLLLYRGGGEREGSLPEPTNKVFKTKGDYLINTGVRGHLEVQKLLSLHPEPESYLEENMEYLDALYPG